MHTDNHKHPDVSEADDTPWILLNLPEAQVAITEEGEIKEEKLARFHESFSAALDLTAPEDIIEAN